MACKESEEKCFTFLWKLENVSYCLRKKGELIFSPVFVVDALDRTKWKLGLYPSGDTDGNYIACYLCRQAESAEVFKIGIKYELAFVAKDGSVLKSSTVTKHEFNKGFGQRFPKFQSREEVFSSKRGVFIPEDILRVRWRIWKSVGEMTEDTRCVARTCIGVEKRSFLWNVKQFSTLELESKCTHQINSMKNDATLMSIDLCLTGGLSSEDIIHFELTLQDETIKFATLKLCLIDVDGNRVECNQDEFRFLNIQNRQFTFFFTKKKLLAKKSTYLPDDVLSLHWDFVFSKGVVLEEIEEVRCGPATYEKKIRDIQSVNTEISVPLSHKLNDNLKSLYDKQFLCDVKLKTVSSVFPAHKIILSAASTVFNAMFANDMKEKNGDCVDIEDLNDDAVRRMLLYIYTARVEDVTWESASHLYVAADKYAILSLKNICSSYLKDNLSSSNVCEVLSLADMHADDDLKYAAQDYILKHDKDIINSDEWKRLMETDAKLAAETLCLRYKQN